MHSHERLLVIQETEHSSMPHEAWDQNTDRSDWLAVFLVQELASKFHTRNSYEKHMQVSCVCVISIMLE